MAKTPESKGTGYQNKVFAKSAEEWDKRRSGFWHAVFFNEGYTRQQHFAFLAERWSVSSPEDDRKIAGMLGFVEESKGIYVVWKDIRRLYGDILHDPGVKKVVQAVFKEMDDILGTVRHPYRRSFADELPEWVVKFVADDKLVPVVDWEEHFKTIGFRPNIIEKFHTGSGDYCIPTDTTEEDIYKILADPNICYITRNTAGKFN